MSEPTYLTIEDAMKRAQVSRHLIKQWIKEGMPVRRINDRMVRIHVEEFDAFLAVKFEGSTQFRVVSPTPMVEKFMLEKSMGYGRRQ